MPATDWDPTEFQRTIQRWLDRTGMSQNQAADFCGISQSVFNRWMQTERRYLVQPTEGTLERLAPKIGIDHDELLRLAGRRRGGPAPQKPAELLALLQEIEAGYHDAAEHERSMRVAATLSLWPRSHARRPDRRKHKSDNSGLDKPMMDYRSLSRSHK